MSAVEEPRQPPGDTGPQPPAGMPEDLLRQWYRERVRELRARVHSYYFFMGLVAFGAIAGVVMAALGVSSQEPGFYAGTAIAPAIVAGGLLGLRRLNSGGKD